MPNDAREQGYQQALQLLAEKARSPGPHRRGITEADYTWGGVTHQVQDAGGRRIIVDLPEGQYIYKSKDYQEPEWMQQARRENSARMLARLGLLNKQGEVSMQKTASQIADEVLQKVAGKEQPAKVIAQQLYKKFLRENAGWFGKGRADEMFGQFVRQGKFMPDAVRHAGGGAAVHKAVQPVQGRMYGIMDTLGKGLERVGLGG